MELNARGRMANVYLRSVLGVLEELVDSLVPDPSQRRILRQKFLQHLESEERILLEGDGAGSSSAQRLKASKKRLEDACFVDIASVCHTAQGLLTLNAIRKLYERDLEEAAPIAQEPANYAQANEMTSLMSSVFKKSEEKKWEVWLQLYVPIIKWTRNYSWREDLRGDLFAGCTVAFMTFPQAMGYALLAGLPPIYGLYSSFIPVFIYSIFGTSAEMCVGPAAMVSLMIPAILGKLAPQGSDQYIMYATFLSFLSGAILFLAGVANAGFLVENLLSIPLLTGWIQGAAILIIVSQLAGFLDIKIPSSSNSIISGVKAITDHITHTNVASFIIGLVCLILLLAVRKLGETKAPIIKKLPISLLVLTGVTALSATLHWQSRYGISIVGKIPEGLPSPGFFTITWPLIQDSIKASLAISIIGFMEGISLAKKFAALRRYRINVSQELRALGLANMVGAIFSSFPVTGSVTRTSVNYQAGSRTTYSSVINAILVGCVLLFLAPLFFYTPKTSLAAIVMAAGISLIDIHEIIFLWKIGAYVDLIQLLSIFIVTLFTGPEVGAVVAILFSVLHIIYRATRPHFMTLAPVHGTSVYKPEPKTSTLNSPLVMKGILVVKLESSVYFYTTAWLKEWLHRWETNYPTPVNSLIFDGSNMNAADATGVHTLKDIVEEHKKRDVCVFFTNLKPRLRKTMELSGLIDLLGPDCILGTVHEAVQLAETISISQRKAFTQLSIN